MIYHPIYSATQAKSEKIERWDGQKLKYICPVAKQYRHCMEYGFIGTWTRPGTSCITNVSYKKCNTALLKLLKGGIRKKEKEKKSDTLFELNFHMSLIVYIYK